MAFTVLTEGQYNHRDIKLALKETNILFANYKNNNVNKVV